MCFQNPGNSHFMLPISHSLFFPSRTLSTFCLCDRLSSCDLYSGLYSHILTSIFHLHLLSSVLFTHLRCFSWGNGCIFMLASILPDSLSTLLYIFVLSHSFKFISRAFSISLKYSNQFSFQALSDYSSPGVLGLDHYPVVTADSSSWLIMSSHGL